jgi:hypothetical protein
MILAEADWPDMTALEPRRALLLPPLYLLCLFCFVAPGLALARLGVRRLRLPAELTVPAGIVVSCLLGYVVFWAYFASPWLGLLTAVAVSAPALLLWLPGPGAGAEVRTQLALMGAVGFFYIAAEHVVREVGRPDLGLVRYRFADRKLFYDCYFPLFFAQLLHDGKDPRDLFNHWRSSDRPPLQTGLFLMQSWLWERGPEEPWVHYHLVGCAVQCSWVPAVWGLCRLLRLPRRRCGVVVLLVACGGFALVNTVYCWPKMLAGALTLFSLETLILAGRSSARLPCGVLAGAAAALALLAHGGAIFTLLAMALFALTPSLFPGWRSSLVGVAVAAALLAPWLAYQQWYDHPGDRLQKWHLAGLHDIDPRPFHQALADAYRGLTPAELARRRLLNLGALFVDVPAENEMRMGEPLRPEQERMFLVRFRDAQLHHLFPALLLLNVGWPLLLLYRLGRRGDAETALERRLLGVAFLSIMLWVLLMYSAGTTILHHGSYADVLLLMTLLGGALCRRGDPLVYGVLVPHTLLFVYVWLLTTPTYSPATLNVALIPVTAAAFVVLVGIALGGWDSRLERWLRRRLSRTEGRGGGGRKRDVLAGVAADTLLS